MIIMFIIYYQYHTEKLCIITHRYTQCFSFHIIELILMVVMILWPIPSISLMSQSPSSSIQCNVHCSVPPKKIHLSPLLGCDSHFSCRNSQSSRLQGGSSISGTVIRRAFFRGMGTCNSPLLCYDDSLFLTFVLQQSLFYPFCASHDLLAIRLSYDNHHDNLDDWWLRRW